MMAAAILGAAPALAAGGEQHWTIIPPLFLNENDSLSTDRHYTSGVYGAATSGKMPDCGWCGSLAGGLMLPTDAQRPDYHYGFFVGQSMFTPEDLSTPTPDPKDWPYGGWLFAGARLYRETPHALDRAQVTVGVVGPASGADALQRFWHALHWFGGVPPEGWHAQLKDEPGLVLSEQRIWRRPHPMGAIETELLPEVNAAIGNVYTYAGAGLTFRFGQGLAADWGPPRIAPALEGSDFANFDELNPTAWYFFAGFEGRLVGRNIFLDGNSFQHSASVTKNPLVGDFSMGGAFLWKWARLHGSYTLRSQEFKTQHGIDGFFSLSVSFAI